MVGMITSREPIKGAVAKEMQQHISRVAEAKKLGTAVWATSQHKTNVNLKDAACGEKWYNAYKGAGAYAPHSTN